jgi:succinate-semialdehyde dehydrogenase / glutarate-semialdehyde dehydrogenase
VALTDPLRMERTPEPLKLPGTPDRLFIGGQWRDSVNGATVDVEDPATTDALATIASAGPDDALLALDAAAAAQESWAATAPRARADVLSAAYQVLTQRSEEFALRMTLEMGKPLAQARGEVAYAAEFFRWYAEEATRVAGRWAMAPDGASRLVTMKHPVGPTLMVTPWNFPLAMGARKIAPAIAAGCTAIVKPALQTPLSMLALADVLREVGIPPGVLNVIPTADAAAVVEPLMNDPRLRKLTFTGSTSVGRGLVRQSANHLLRLSMELGGNAPFIVFADADIDEAVDGAMLAKMRNMGQACTAANRFIVHADVADEFTTKLVARMSREIVGPGTAPGVTVGPLIDGKAVAKVTDLVEDAANDGATIRLGGTRLSGAGYFYAPTVLTGAPEHSAIAREEIFGPVASIATFTDVDRALALANQRHAVRARLLRLHAKPRHRAPDRGGAPRRHGRCEPRAGLQPGSTLRRDQALGVRPRGWARGHRGVPRDQEPRPHAVAGWPCGSECTCPATTAGAAWRISSTWRG